MKRKLVAKKGDTLIEVALAVGIFSMVAIAILSVMNGSASNAQTALEATLAREEVDAQAEAIRFIHSAYVANNKSSSDSATGHNGLWEDLWGKIVGGAMSPDAASGSSNFYDYQPETCGELYGESDKAISGNSFVIDVRKLANGDKSENVVVKKSEQGSKFQPASTYPRLIYNGGNMETASGIYITAVQDSGTQIVQGGSVNAFPAYYDFYIRTCWYGTSDKTPSTVSTVIRLYNPAIESNN